MGQKIATMAKLRRVTEKLMKVVKNRKEKRRISDLNEFRFLFA